MFKALEHIKTRMREQVALYHLVQPTDWQVKSPYYLLAASLGLKRLIVIYPDQRQSIV